MNKKKISLALLITSCLVAQYSSSYAGKIKGEWEFVKYQQRKQGNFADKQEKKLSKITSTKKSVAVTYPSLPTHFQLDMIENTKTHNTSSSPVWNLQNNNTKFIGILLLTSMVLPVTFGNDLNECTGQECSRIIEKNISPETSTKHYQSSLDGLNAYARSVTPDYENYPLDEGRIEYDGNELVQIVNQNNYVLNPPLSRVKLLIDVTVTLPCQKFLKHIGWKDDDRNLQSYKRYSIYAKRGEKEREVVGKTETSEIADSYKPLLTYFEPRGEIILENNIPQKQNGRICKKYERPNGSKYILEYTIHDFHLDKKHISFYHDENTKESYQIVKLSVMHEGESYDIDELYHIRGIKYPHLNLFDSWVDDKTNHVSTRDWKIYIDTRTAVDRENIPQAHKIVKDNLTEKKGHDELWSVPLGWIMPWGYNYKIPHSGVTYR